MATKRTPVLQPTTAKEFVLRAATHGLHTLEQLSDNPHDFGKVAGPLADTMRLLWEIECQEREDARRAPRQFPNPTPKCDSNLRRLGAE